MSDRDGNYISIDENYVLRLYLKKGTIKRVIGAIVGRIFFVKRNPSKHTHHLTNSYGFNYHLMASELFDEVKIFEPDGSSYCVKRAEALKNGKVYHFKNCKETSFELQLLLPKSFIYKFVS